VSATEVQQLPLREKLQIMQVIWEDLRDRADQFGISPEQKDLLDARRAKVTAGESSVRDWDSVKHSIGRA